MIRKIEKYHAFILAALIMLFNISAAQTPLSSIPQEVTPLTIGSKLPDDLVLTNVKNYPTQTIRLADLKGKMILLDFWATWCSSCVEGFPKMDELQNEFNNELQVILVNAEQTGDDEEKTKLLFEKRKKHAGYDVTLPYLIGDTNLQKLFPHKYLPNYVWINKEGMVVAITFPAEVTSRNIKTVLNTGSVKLHTKKDMAEFDSQKPLFSNEMEETGTVIKYRSMLTGYIEGIGFKIGAGKDDDNKINRYYILNYPLDFLYKDAFRNELNNIPDNRMIFDTPRHSDFKSNFFDAGNYDNKYCYEILTPGSTIEQLHKYYREDLVRNFGVTVKREPRKTKVIVLTYSDKLKKSFTKGGETIIHIGAETKRKFARNVPVSTLTGIFNMFFKVPVIDESLVKESIDFEFPENFTGFDIAEIKRLLQLIGFKIKEEERLLDFAVFTDGLE